MLTFKTSVQPKLDSVEVSPGSGEAYDTIFTITISEYYYADDKTIAEPFKYLLFTKDFEKNANDTTITEFRLTNEYKLLDQTFSVKNNLGSLVIPEGLKTKA